MSSLKPWQKLLIFLIVVYAFRLFFGLCSEFWFEDERQIYLLGLKFYTTGEWPYFGPDLVYTKSQIPGALQALLVGLPFYVLPMPEAPYILLNILSLASLVLLCWYCMRRMPEIPPWFIWVWILTAPWTLNFSTHVYNPSYVLFGAVLFFVGAMESYPFLTRGLIPLPWANFMMGISILWIFQLHMSWIILIPFLLASFYFQCKTLGKKIFHSIVYFALGTLLSASLIIPTFVKYGFFKGWGGTGTSIQFTPGHFLEFFTVLARFLSFASFELSRFIGPNTQERLAFLRQNPWIIPFAVFLGLVGIVQPVAMTVLWFSKRHPQKDWRGMKYLALATFLIVFFSFTFSVKGPSSHAFYLVFPVAMIYSFYCWSRFFRNRKWKTFATVFLLAGIIFHTGLAVSRAPQKSLYKDRNIPKLAIEKKDYRILGERRQAYW